MGVGRLPSGSCRARVMVDGQSCTATFATEAEAAEWVMATRGRFMEIRVNRRLTVEQYADRWLSAFIDTAASIDHSRRDVADHILPDLGVRPLAEVSPAEIARLLEQVEADTSGAVADQVRATVRQLFADAVDERLIASSPAQPVRRAGMT